MEGDELSRGCCCLGEVEMAGEEKKIQNQWGGRQRLFL